ncbi:Probable inactive histone-lysine N-methyltransferase SUVR2 [Linum perenne]
MPPNPRLGKAFQAMKGLGFEADTVRPVLKRLVKLFNKNFALIEEDNYRALADAILDDMEANAQAPEKEKEKIVDEGSFDEVPLRPRKRLRSQRLGDQEGLVVSPSSGNHSPLANGAVPSQEPVTNGAVPSEQCLPLVTKGKEPMSCQVSPRGKRRPLPGREIAIWIEQPAKRNVADSCSLIVPKDEPFTDEMPLDELPLAVIRPGKLFYNSMAYSVMSKFLTFFGGEFEGVQSSADSEYEAAQEGNCLVTSRKPRVKPDNGRSSTSESSSGLEIASSSSGEVKLSLSFQPLLERPNFKMPTLNNVLKSVEERCSQRSSLDENLTVLEIMKETCQCFLKLTTD